ncbi:YdeI/OmpD-associated family protein [Actinoplanes sp. NPDC051851]|uniref:YdeI/OmpD-associated family protein n=1 Tax=Actinoplanes sp. NPDC051851 TaxID=3154753 RepID=UPI0034199B47
MAEPHPTAPPTALKRAEGSLFFRDPAALRAWFTENHETAPEALIAYWKKGSGETGITHPQAIEQALCFGWIDSVSRRIDEKSYYVRFTPRRRGSVWSEVNIAKVGELTERGLMLPAGLRAFAARRPDRVGVYSYEQAAPTELDAAQTARLRGEPAAWEWFNGQSAGYRRAAVHWVVSAKRPETRERRLAQLVADSAAGRRVPPLISR